MTLFEILNFYREPLKRLVLAGFKPDDCKYLDAYNEYRNMTSGGGKKSWAVAVVSEKYGISEPRCGISSGTWRVTARAVQYDSCIVFFRFKDYADLCQRF